MLTECFLPHSFNLTEASPFNLTDNTYKVIVWKQIDGKTGTELYIFPNNFHQLDYYE